MKPGSPHQTPTRREATWGPWLFRLTFVGVLIFFWWLLIYSHGVAPSHG